MVVDPVGLTLGLASLFAASLEVLDRISAAKSYGKDYLLFVTKVETERLRLFLWGKAVGLSGTSASSQHLQDPQIRIKVSELLNWAIQLFEDSETFKTRHSKDMVVTSSTPGQGGSLVATGKKASAMMRIKWVLSGKRKSEKLLQDLSWFVDKLHELVPPSGAVVLAGQPVSATNVLRLTGGSHRVESRARRTRKHARRIAVGMDKKLKEIRVDERKRLEREKAYFWQMATFGGASGTLAFFLNPCRPPYARDFAKTHAVVTGIKVQGIMRGNDDVTSCISKIS